jgi:hypothetical protein
LGKLVAQKVWTRVQAYFDGSARPTIQQTIASTTEPSPKSEGR